MKWLAILLLARTVLSNDNNPDENQGVNDPNLVEGDMILTPQQIYNIEHGLDVNSPGRKRGSRRSGLWPGGVLVYTIGPSLARNSRASAAIRAGMDEWTTKTCIRFRQRTNEAAHVYFRFGSGCSSSVGRTGRRQFITLASGCWTRGIVTHEIGHALGFFHEQSRPDRDNFVRVVYANIQAGRENNFRKYPRSLIDSLGTPYDYGSIMHYGSRAFSKNRLPTIVVKQPGAVIGQRRGLSAVDASQANLLYRCRGVPTVNPVTNRPTQGPTPSNSGCSNYRLLSESDRNRNVFRRFGQPKCDRGLPRAWYRFSGAAGRQMPTQCVGRYRCGTHAPGWLSGGHPAANQGPVVRRVCFSWSRGCCQWSQLIRVENCGAFFVYELSRPPVCNLRFCGDSGSAPTRPPTRPPTAANCRDRMWWCRIFSRRCSSSPFMRRFCKRTCNNC